jgi:hypothetical protein
VALCICAIVVAFATRGAIGGVHALGAQHLPAHLPAFGIAAICLGGCVVIYGCVWSLLVAASAPVTSEDRPKLLVAFLYAWPSRYVPGAIPFFASKVFLCRKLGYGTRPAVISTSIQNLVDIIVGAGVAGILLAAAGALSTDNRALLVVLVFSPAGLLLLHPAVLRPVANRGLAVFRREPLLEQDVPSWQRLVTAAGLTFVAQCLAGIALLAVLSSVTTVHATDAPLVSGALSLGGVAGMFAVFAPAGLGVREGAVASALSLRFSLETAALAALLLRGISVLVDVTLFGAAVAYDTLRRDPLAGRVLGRAPGPRARAVQITEDPAP